MNLFAQRRAIDEFHGDEMRAGLLANFVDVRDVRVIQGGGSLRLLNEAPHSILVGRHIRGQNFQRHPPPQLRILRQIHLAHSALANLGADFIAAEFCAGGNIHLVARCRLANCFPDDSKLTVSATVAAQRAALNRRSAGRFAGCRIFDRL